MPIYTFEGSASGTWEVENFKTIAGEPVQKVNFVTILSGSHSKPTAAWSLHGATSNERYATRAEKDRLTSESPPLDRPGDRCAALIPIAKSAEWWSLGQDERRSIFEEQSKHISVGLKYLPAIARRLHHSRDLGEPFDFLTWFEFAPEHAGAFDELVGFLRSSLEWKFVTREIDIRLRR